MLKVLLIQLGFLGNLLKVPPKPPAPFVPLGLLHLISYAQRKVGSTVEFKLSLLDADYRNWREVISDWRGFSPDLIGLSGTFNFQNLGKKVIKLLRYLFPNSMILVGGPMVNGAPQDALKKLKPDGVVVGEGEVTFTKIIETIINGNSPYKVRGTLWRVGENIILNPQGERLKELDEIPFLAWEYLPLELYKSGFNMNELPILGDKYVTLFTSRGCPFNCYFCHNFFGRSIRARSIKLVVDEMEYLYERFGVNEFHFVDDAFNLIPNRIVSLYSEIKRRGLNFYLVFPNGLRGDVITKDEIKKLKEIGTYSLAFSLESGSQKTLKLMNKKLNLNRLLHNVEVASEEGLFTSTSIIVGYPGEDEQDIRQSFEVAAKSKFDWIRILIATPYPGTYLFEQAKALSPKFKEYINRAEYFNFDPMVNRMNLTNMSDEKFFELVEWGREYILSQPHRQKRLDYIKNFFEQRGRQFYPGRHWYYKQELPDFTITDELFKKIKQRLDKELGVDVSREGENIVVNSRVKLKLVPKDKVKGRVEGLASINSFFVVFGGEIPDTGLSSKEQELYKRACYILKELIEKNREK